MLLARALVSAPKLLVPDEPTTGLDAHAAESFWCAIDRLRESGAGVLAVTHDLPAALSHATHVLKAEGDTASPAAASDWIEGGDAA